MPGTVGGQWEEKVDRFLARKSQKGANHALEGYTVAKLMKLKAPPSGGSVLRYRLGMSKVWDDKLLEQVTRGTMLVKEAVGVPDQKIEKAAERVEQLQELRQRQARWRQAQIEEADVPRPNPTRGEALQEFRSGARQMAEDGFAKYGKVFEEEVDAVSRKRKLDKIVHVVQVAKEPALMPVKMEGDRPARRPTPRPAPAVAKLLKAPFSFMGRPRR